MRCPLCDHPETRVLDSRLAEDGRSVRRRRECERCNKRFTTYERSEDSVLVVVKKDGGREKFDRQKILNGLLRACEKRPVTLQQMEKAVSSIENTLRNKGDGEVSSDDVGACVMDVLTKLDDVAYVRFASVYKEFKDVGSFAEELRILEQVRRGLTGDK